MRILALLSSVFFGCASLDLAECRVKCEQNGPCPSGWSCRGDGFCHPGEATEPFSECLAAQDATANASDAAGWDAMVDSSIDGAVDGAIDGAIDDRSDARPIDATPPPVDAPMDAPRDAPIDAMEIDAASEYTLKVTKLGLGKGRVYSIASGISCGTFCQASFGRGTVVRLAYTLDEGSSFNGWTGDCFGMDECKLTMDSAKSVSATFIDTSADSTWVRQIGGIGDERAWDVAVDGSGNVLLVGDYSGSVDFGGEIVSTSGATNGFAAKYTADGTLAWVRRIERKKSDFMAVAVSSGHVVVAATYLTQLVAGGTSYTSPGSSPNTQAWVGKYSEDGAYLWGRDVGGSMADSVTGLAMDDWGDVYLAGVFEGNDVDFGDGPVTREDPSLPAAFLIKLDSAGKLEWKKIFEHARIAAVAVGPTGSRISVAGEFWSAMSFGGDTFTPAGKDVFLANYSSMGGHAWSRRIFGPSDDTVTDLAMDEQGVDVAITGRFEGNLQVDNVSLSGLGQSDFYIALYDGQGKARWARGYGGTSTNEATLGVAVGPYDLWISGWFSDPMSFGIPGLTTPSSASKDAFFAKYHAGREFLSIGDQPNKALMTWGASLDDFGAAVAVSASGFPVFTGHFDGIATFDGKDYNTRGGTDIFLIKRLP
ncbi:MAG: hypothetical protein HY698_18320 [Deltaproteobacteria bacterium]|nr:hypothetical protein [Deltaproteobacteria bacterium]